MWTVEQQPVSMEQWRVPLGQMQEQEERVTLESVLLHLLDLRRNVLELSPIVGVQDREIQVKIYNLKSKCD